MDKKQFDFLGNGLDDLKQTFNPDHAPDVLKALQPEKVGLRPSPYPNHQVGLARGRRA